MSSERAGVHTSGALNREKLIERLSEIVRSPDFNAADEADYIIEACVVPDPRLGRIEAAVDDARQIDEDDDEYLLPEDATPLLHRLREILRGDA